MSLTFIVHCEFINLVVFMLLLIHIIISFYHQ